MRILDLRITVNNTASGRWIGDAGELRPRSLHVHFDWRQGDRHDGPFDVLLYGDAIPDDSGGPWTGQTGYGPQEAFGAISTLRKTWQRRVIEYRTAAGRYPFSAEWDLSGPADQAHLDAVGLHLARAGRDLFNYLFRHGDDGLKRIATLIEDALRRQHQLIEIHSDDLFAPWWMLYTPRDPADRTSWDLDGFWGFRHLIQHTPKRHHEWSPKIIASVDQLPVGMNVDDRIDTDPRTGRTPYVEPLRNFFQERTDTVVRREKAELAEAIQDEDFPDKLMYFFCHGRVSGADGAGTEQPSLTLSDNNPILPTDFETWFAVQPLQTNPVVFIGACQGGQMSSPFYKAFGKALLKAGANCVIGPQVDLPVAFAKHYGEELFTRFLTGNYRLGDAVHELTRIFAEKWHNPLGLTISLYRGMDTRLVIQQT